MPLSEDAKISALVDAIEHASFPDSEEVLSYHVNHATIPPLLQAINLARDDLSESVRTVSKKEAGDVDGWIEQAKKVQADIAKCKEDAKHIIHEYERIESLQRVRDEAQSKSLLIQAEIAFNEALERQFQMISEASATLSQVEVNIQQGQFILAAQMLLDIEASIHDITSDQSRALLHRIYSGLRQRLAEHLRVELVARFFVSTLPDEVHLYIVQNSSERTDFSKTDKISSLGVDMTLDQILHSAELLGLLEEFAAQLSRQIDAAILPYLHKRSKFKIANAEDRGTVLCLVLTSDLPSTTSSVSAAAHLVKYLHSNCPNSVRENLTQNILVRLVPLLIADWLDPAIPTELDDLKDLDELLKVVTDFDEWLRSNDYREAKMLQGWVNQVPRTWLSKRRTFSLDTVRKAFKLANGSTTQVERVETQTIAIKGERPVDSNEDDWADSWDDYGDQDSSNDEKQTEDTGDDGSDAWGFDNGDQQIDTSEPPAKATLTSQNQEDEGDAWGWGDDEEEEKPDPIAPKPTSRGELNGKQVSTSEHKDVVLRESYTITDVPARIIEQINKDLADHQRLLASPSTYFKLSTVPSTGLGSLPTLTLAMFRAIATTSYRSDFSPPLSNMNIYNDTLFLASRLTTGADDTSTATKSAYSVIESELPVLEKFARQVYTSELSIHRTILLDLLDTAQGFVSCTRSPYAETCETAISSTVDHIRSLHKEWSPILSPSHLCQSVGSLLNSIMRKIIEDIEDMEDISEPESRKLLRLCESVSQLQDLFLVERPTAEPDDHSVGDGPVSTIALHCTSYLRFQYLQQILESNLVEIRYLWTDAGLSLEFRPDEVVDLIKALFAESSQRRGAINAIKSSA